MMSCRSGGRFLMLGPGVAMVSAAWLIHSSWDLWLPWLEVVGVLGVSVAGRTLCHLPTVLFPPSFQD